MLGLICRQGFRDEALSISQTGGGSTTLSMTTHAKTDPKVPIGAAAAG